jgi:hypothetical protein
VPEETGQHVLTVFEDEEISIEPLSEQLLTAGRTPSRRSTSPSSAADPSCRRSCCTHWTVTEY